jgi:Secretion system C-terminal sorting domain
MYKFFFTLVFLMPTSIMHAFTPKIVAGQVFYEYVGPLQYDVHFMCYTNCDDTFSNTNIPMMVYASQNCGISKIVQLHKLAVSNGIFISKACPNSTCTDSLNTCDGYWQYHYSATISLDTFCTEWVFQVNVNRPSNFSNISIGNSGSCIATLNNIARPSNSSIVTLLPQFLITGNNIVQSLLLAPYDADNDSLVFETHYTLDSSSYALPQSINFNAGYTIQNPIGNNNVYAIHPNTGEINFNALNTGLHIITTKELEYDRITKQLIATRFVDHLLCISPCYSHSVDFINPIPPYINSLTGALFSIDTNSDINALINVPFNFKINLKPKVSNNVKQIKSDNLNTAKGSIFSYSINANNEIEIQMSWTPKNIDTGIHIVNILIEDSINCNSFTPIPIPLKINVLNLSLSSNLMQKTNLNSCYPNPAKGTLYYSHKHQCIPKSHLIIKNIYGQIVYQNATDELSAIAKIDIANFSKGFYFLTNTMDGFETKFVVE